MECKLIKGVLPHQLLEALSFIFSQGLNSVALVGGTALAGFYAGHRRSDDIDLWVKDIVSFDAAVFTIKKLKEISTEIEVIENIPGFFNATCKLKGHSFSVQVVVDEHFFNSCSVISVANGIVVADITSLLKMKSATLLSRCSEKDLFDLIWILKQFPHLKIKELIDLGRELDGGMNAESVFMSVAGTVIRKEACGFSLKKNESEVFVYKKIKKFQKELVNVLEKEVRKMELPEIAKLFKF